MTFAAEPYGVFVDDLLSSLTGGITRERFTFLAENRPFRLGFAGDVLPGTVRAHGIAEEAYRRFHDGIDFELETASGTLVWLDDGSGLPAAGATWPDRGSPFYVSYERKPESRPAPLLTDRNPGSVTRTLAESLAREFAVLSQQLERIYQAGFLETATARDLDHVAALVGVARRTRLFATGEAVFARTTPAPADVFIPEGTLLSSADEPLVTVETTEDRTLRSGTLSVSAPVRALAEGVAGVARAGTLTVIHRPILGIASVANPQAMSLGGANESDPELRRRAARALETGGRSTLGALRGALTAIDGIEDKHIQIKEDFLAAPGVLKITVASDLDEARARRAARALDEARPAGIRVIHNLPVTPEPTPPPAPGTGVGSADGIWLPIGVRAEVTPSGINLTAPQKNQIKTKIETALGTTVEELGIGETIVYNRLVAAVMALEQVFDVSLDLYLIGGGTTQGRQNLAPSPPDTRPRLDELEVTIRGALIALDVSVEVQRLGLAATGDGPTALAGVRDEIATRLADLVATAPGEINQAGLFGGLTDTETYHVDSLAYTAEFLEEGLQVRRANVTITPQSGQQPWIRTVQVTEEVQS